MAWHDPIDWTAATAMSVTRLNEQIRDNLDALKALADAHATQHTGAGSDMLYYKRQETWHVAGNVGTGATQNATLTYRGPSGMIVRADAVVETAPVGADLICDINLGGTSIWNATPANRVKVADGATSGTQTSFDTTAIADGNVLTLDVDQVGSGAAGADLTVRLQIKCPVETS